VTIAFSSSVLGWNAVMGLMPCSEAVWLASGAARAGESVAVVRPMRIDAAIEILVALFEKRFMAKCCLVNIKWIFLDRSRWLHQSGLLTFAIGPNGGKITVLPVFIQNCKSWRDLCGNVANNGGLGAIGQYLFNQR
jgi:hypothetical protein